jgi:hypothetical protein
MESWKYCRLRNRLLELSNDIWNAGRIPKEWEKALIINAHKRDKGKFTIYSRRTVKEGHKSAGTQNQESLCWRGTAAI